MTNPKDPANPVDINYPNGERAVRVGLTKLEYFAGIALQGILASRQVWADEKELAEEAVIYAKALITELNKEQ